MSVSVSFGCILAQRVEKTLKNISNHQKGYQHVCSLLDYRDMDIQSSSDGEQCLYICFQQPEVAMVQRQSRVVLCAQATTHPLPDFAVMLTSQ